MPNKSSKLPLKTDLLHFYEEFVEFQDYCSFMCEAFASLAAEENYLDTSTAMGASRFCHWIKRRMHELKGDLKRIHEKAHTQNQISSKAQKRKRNKTHSA